MASSHGINVFVFVFVINSKERRKNEMILEKEKEICVNGKNRERLAELGYKAICGQTILVKNEDLSPASHVEEERVCDECGQKTVRPHRTWIKQQKEYGKDLCFSCMEKIRQEKIQKTSLEKYGTKNPSSSPLIREKVKNTNLEKYGVTAPLASKQVYATLQKNLKEKYGVENMAFIPGVKEKRKKTNLEKYGTEYASSSVIIRKKVTDTNLKRYGKENPMQVKEFRTKAMKTLREQDGIPVSKQQRKIYEICKKNLESWEVELNYPCCGYALDIYVFSPEGIKIDIEYDGSYWHKNKAEEDKKRNDNLIEEGYKVLRIKSKILLPSWEQIFQALSELNKSKRDYLEIILPDWEN